MFKDGHHILHNRLEWSLRPESKRLRETPSLIPRLDRETHDEIHRTCPPVPLLGYYALMRVNKLFEPSRNTLESIDSLLDAIDEANHHPKAHPLERQLGDAAMWAIELQIPAIADALDTRTIIDLGAAR